MKEKKKINISVLLMLLAIIIVIGISYAAFVFITNSGIIEANSGKLDIAYNIEKSSVNGTLIPSSTRSGGISTSVTAKLNSGSIPGNINLYITPTALTGMPFSSLMWEVDVVDTSDNLLTHYEGDFTGSVINTPVKITDAYSLTTNLLTFKIYIWLNGERINNENYNSNNGFTATISADSISITGEFDPTYTVTFDADGGIGASGTKSVRVGEDYGLLPTPTKTGYTFLGWNGKNMFNEEKILMAIDGATYENSYYNFKANSANSLYSDGITNISYFKSSTQYTLSFIGYTTFDNQFTNYRIGFKTSSNEYMKFLDRGFTECKTEGDKQEVTSGANETVSYLYMTYGWDGTIHLKDVQLEEGTIATPYEPYYVTSGVTVTRTKNHTLTAIWEKNPNAPNQNINDYQEVEYIESSGTQYIDTNYYLSSNNANLKVKVNVSNMPSDEQDIISNQDNSTGRFVVGLFSQKVFTYSRDNSKMDANISSSIYEGSNTFEIEANYDYDNHMKTLKVDDEVINQTQNAMIANANQTIKIFRAGHDDLYMFSGKLYYLKIYDNGVLVRDFIPAYRKSDEEVGLYDTVNDVFYQNAGTGDFIAGPDVTNS